MAESVTITFAAALVLDSVMQEILYDKVKTPDGTIVKVERDLPFRLKYRIEKNKAYIDKDVEDFNRYKLQLLATYGESDEIGQNVIIKDPEKKKLFIQSMNNVLLKQITHPISKIDPADLESLNHTTGLSYDEFKVFIGYMCDEPEFITALNTEIDFDFGQLDGTKAVNLEDTSTSENSSTGVTNGTTEEKTEADSSQEETEKTAEKKTSKRTRKSTTSKKSTSRKKKTEEKGN